MPTAVIAHPMRYGFSATAKRNLFEAFKALGGDGIEVHSGNCDKNDRLNYALLAERFGLMAGCGSDFYRLGDYVRKRGRHVFAEGRKKDVINRGGEKISCEEVENLIFRHPKVQQVALVAMPDPLFGERACAFVVTKPGESLDFAELIAFLRAQRIASFKLPERLGLVEQLPTSLVGKILKRQLRERIAERLKAEAGPAVPH